MEQLKLEFEEEIWKDIKGYEGLYQISKYGIVKSLERVIKNRRNNILQDKMLSTDSVRQYLRVNLSKNKRQKWYSVHRLVGIHFVPNPESKPEVNHKKGIKVDNFYKELEWVTKSENHLHAYRIGLQKISSGQKLAMSLANRGEKNNKAKLTEKQILEIRKLKKEGTSVLELSNTYKTCITNIRGIVNRKFWKHI